MKRDPNLTSCNFKAWKYADVMYISLQRFCPSFRCFMNSKHSVELVIGTILLQTFVVLPILIDPLNLCRGGDISYEIQ